MAYGMHTKEKNIMEIWMANHTLGLPIHLLVKGLHTWLLDMV